MNIPASSLKRIAAERRIAILEMCHRAGTPHLGSCLSCVDILVALYWEFLRVDPGKPECPGRDRFILSKGHAAPALYSVLAGRGFFPETLLQDFAQEGSCLGEHPGIEGVPGVEWATGSLGHGLPVGLGMAWSGRLHGNPFRTVVLISDGECNEGTTWEAALLAAGQALGSLTVVVDYNKWQATDRSNSVMALAPLRTKWEAFGWEAVEIDGHDFSQIIPALHRGQASRNRPLAIVAHTIKGRGVSFMEDDNNWHYRCLSALELRQARGELEGMAP